MDCQQFVSFFTWNLNYRNRYGKQLLFFLKLGKSITSLRPPFIQNRLRSRPRVSNPRRSRPKQVSMQPKKRARGERIIDSPPRHSFYCYAFTYYCASLDTSYIPLFVHNSSTLIRQNSWIEIVCVAVNWVKKTKWFIDIGF